MVLDTVLWDAGGVILNFDQNLTDRRLAIDADMDPEKVSEVLFGATAGGREYNGGLVEGYNLGKVSSEAFFRGVKETLGLKMSYGTFVETWGNIFRPNPLVIQHIKDLHSKGVRQGVLSSTNPIHWEYTNGMFDLEGLLGSENIMCTFHPDAGHKKPTPELFEAAMNRLGVDKSQVVYVDDVKKYIDGAIAFDMGGVVHVDLGNEDHQERAIRDLENLGFTV